MMLARRQAQDLLAFIDASPSPWHVVASVEQRLGAAGFVALDEAAPWPLQPGGRYYTVRGGGSIIAFTLGEAPPVATGFSIIAAHTDSPGLRLKPNAAGQAEGWLRLAVDIYGTPILATYADRDLSLAGRVSHLTAAGGVASRLLRFDQPLLRLPNLPIHLNRAVNEDGLKFNKHSELPLLLAAVADGQLPAPRLRELLGLKAGVDGGRIVAWDLQVYDTQPGAFWGGGQEFIANGQLDNLACCHAALTALVDGQVLAVPGHRVLALFDHEEVGSQSSQGAAGSFLADVLARIAEAWALSRQDHLRALARSFLISADMAHAHHPNFPQAYDADHRATVNRGPVIKVDANQRYSTGAPGAACFARWCGQAGVPYQSYAHRCDLACGGTIGPMLSASLGMTAVDVGNPMWAMHSLRESAGVHDHHYLIKALQAFLVDRGRAHAHMDG